jgi:hypothetical protein
LNNHTLFIFVIFIIVVIIVVEFDSLAEMRLGTNQ